MRTETKSPVNGTARKPAPTGQPLKERCLDLLERARDLNAEPDILATCFALIAGIVEGPAKSKAEELSAWFACEAELSW
jgi:hypothetical protein